MPSIIALFAIPDAAATVEYGFEKPSVRYPKWFDMFVDTTAGMNGQTAWLVRNALIHETAVNWRAAGYHSERLLIGVPDPNGHAAVLHGFSIGTIDGNRSGVIELDILAEAILKGAERWLEDAEKDVSKASRLAGMMQIRPDGLSPYMVGKPIIA